MKIPKFNVTSSTSLSSIPEGTYSEKIQTFSGQAAPVVTAGPSGSVRYGLFISDRVARAGSYAVTSSSQDTYRTLNTSLSTKSGKR